MNFSAWVYRVESNSLSTRVIEPELAKKLHTFPSYYPKNLDPPKKSCLTNYNPGISWRCKVTKLCFLLKERSYKKLMERVKDVGWGYRICRSIIAAFPQCLFPRSQSKWLLLSRAFVDSRKFWVRFQQTNSVYFWLSSHCVQNIQPRKCKNSILMDARWVSNIHSISFSL